MTFSAVILAFGPQPVEFFNRASRMLCKNAVFCTDVARMAGATFAMGNQGDLDDLRERLLAGAIERVQDQHQGLSDAAVRWLACGERGISSNYIFSRLTGIDAMQGWDAKGEQYPSDPGDIRRCQLLLEQVPELAADFHKMAGAGPMWAQLYTNWESIIAAMDEESPEWRSGAFNCPAAFDMIQRIIWP